MSPHALRLLMVGLTLLALVNIAVLSGVAWNRSGEPDAKLLLGERELSFPGHWRSREENSGLALTLRWRVEPSVSAADDDSRHEASAYAATPWLDVDRLRALGFALDETARRDPHRRDRWSAREVWLALEFDGPTHARTIRHAEQSVEAAQATLDDQPESIEHQASLRRRQEYLQRVRNEWTRLVVIDADLDADVLRARHPDRQRVAIMHGRVRAGPRFETPYGAPRSRWEGHVEAVSINSIHVPLSQRGPLDVLAGQGQGERHDRYAVSLAFGQRREPWVLAVRPSQGPELAAGR